MKVTATPSPMQTNSMYGVYNMSNFNRVNLSEVTSFTRQHLNDLQDIVDGQYYSEVAIRQAISITDNMEVIILLNNLMNGVHSFEMRMELQHFICGEYHKLTQ